MSEATPVEDLTRDEAAVELERLAGLIAEADAAYYQEDAPLMTDAEYDAARQRNAAIEARFPDLKREDSPSDRVGAAAHEGFAKAAHAAPMLSLDNAFSDEDVEEFAARIRRFLGLDGDEVRHPIQPLEALARNGLAIFKPVCRIPKKFRQALADSIAVTGRGII